MNGVAAPDATATTAAATSRYFAHDVFGLQADMTQAGQTLTECAVEVYKHNMGASQ